MAKIRRSTLSIVILHVIATSIYFPLLWLIGGYFFKLWMISKGAYEIAAEMLYYVIMIKSYYLGIKYSLYHIESKVDIADPRKVARYSVILFSILAAGVNYAFYHYQGSVHLLRLVVSFGIVYMFHVLSVRFFYTLKSRGEERECTVFNQVVIVVANLSMLVSLLVTYVFLGFIGLYVELKEFAFGVQMFFVTAVAYYLYLGEQIPRKSLFVPFLYQEGEPKPIKKAVRLLLVTIPLNVILWGVVKGLVT